MNPTTQVAFAHVGAGVPGWRPSRFPDNTVEDRTGSSWRSFSGPTCTSGHSAGTNLFTYGWNTDRAANAIVRGESPYPPFDTLNQDGTGTPSTGSGTWKLALTNGTYAVALVIGDASPLDQTNNVTINGVAQTDPTPAITTPPSSSAQRGDFDVQLVNATVADGYLTLAGPTTARNPKLCLIEIGKAGSTVDQALRDRDGTLIGNANSFTCLPQFPPRSTSPRT